MYISIPTIVIIVFFVLFFMFQLFKIHDDENKRMSKEIKRWKACVYSSRKYADKAFDAYEKNIIYLRMLYRNLETETGRKKVDIDFPEEPKEEVEIYHAYVDTERY